MASIVLAGALSINSAGCIGALPGTLEHRYDKAITTLEESHICNKSCFFGRLGNEILIFHYGTGSFVYTNVLEVIKQDGTIIDYIDDNLGDLKTDFIKIDDEGEFTAYITGGNALQKGQKEFRQYLIQIEVARQKYAKQKQKDI